MNESSYRVALAVSLLVLGALPACSSPDTPAKGAPSSDAGTEHDNGETPPAGDGGFCNAGNGIVENPTGTLTPTVTNKDANLVESAPMALSCEAMFQAAGGTADGTGGMSGSTEVRCYVRGIPNYYGIVINVPAKWQTGDVFAIGKPGSTRNDAGAFTSNREAGIVYEEGPSCGSNQGKARSWTAAEAAGSVLVIDSVAGADAAFHIVKAAFAPTVGAANDLGTGGFVVEGSGAVKLVEQ